MITSCWRKVSYEFLQLLLKLLVTSKIIPSTPISKLGLDLSQPILYVLPCNSTTNLLTLRAKCLEEHLPDPLDLLNINGFMLPSYIFMHDSLRLCRKCTPIKRSAKRFNDYLDLHCSNPLLNIQILPVSVMFGRSPGEEGHNISHFYLLNSIKKLLTAPWLGSDSFVRFSNVISLRHIVSAYGTDKIIAQKLARVISIQFSRQRLATVGPRRPIRQDLFNKLLASRPIQKAVEDEAHNKNISLDKTRKNALILIEEIAANFSYKAVRFSYFLLDRIWKQLYHSINVTNTDRIQQLAEGGHEIVYLPCHRSHMDYLLLSYVLYQEGLVPPHIVAGINLNFWPVGAIFRRLGAFFIRRSFKGNKLYATIFREYLSELFTRGYSVEYFIEGGRTRTGRLLEPKTGTLAMTIQAMLRGGIRPITLVPIYIGYEHVLEVSAYTKELCGATKKKENLFQLLRGLCKLRSLGQSYVNFGVPLSLTGYLNQHVPQWRESLKIPRPIWLTPTVNNLAKTIMVHINNAAAVNAVNLCASALLASQQYSLPREQLLEQLKCYLQLMRNVPYSQDVIVPTQTPDDLLDYALSINKFIVQHNNFHEIIILPREQVVLMTYYRNNIYHLLVLPSLIATIIINYYRVSCSTLLHYINLLYPMLQAELFLNYEKEQLAVKIQELTNEMICQKLIYSKHKDLILNQTRILPLKLLAAGLRETLQRYAITMSVLSTHSNINRRILEKESRTIARHLLAVHNISIQESFDRSVFATLILTLRTEGYINDIGDVLYEPTIKAYKVLSDLIPPEIRITIESANLAITNNMRHITASSLLKEE